MNSKLKLIIPLFFVTVTAMGFSEPSSKKYMNHARTDSPLIFNVSNSRDIAVGTGTSDSTGIEVGTRNADSTGTASVSNTVIQQSIVSTISLLNNTTVSSDAPSIFVGKQYSYLIFKTSNSTETFKVAVELTLEGNIFKFQSSVPGKQIHVCKDAGVCATCDFFKDENNTITGCGCSSDNVPGGGGCQQFFFFTHP
jgi:hypothetical protein